jgi:hypothetical protein
MTRGRRGRHYLGAACLGASLLGVFASAHAQQPQVLPAVRNEPAGICQSGSGA